MKNTRRTVAFAALGVALAIPSLSDAAGQKTIAFMRGGPDPYYQYGMNAAQAAADKLGVKLVTYTANNDPTQELANVQDAITKGVDGILIYAVSLSSEKAAIAQAKRANVPIFFQYGYDPSILGDSAGIMEINLFNFGEPVGQAIGKMVPTGEYATVTGKLGRGDAEAFAQSFKDGMRNRARKLWTLPIKLRIGIARRRLMRRRKSSPPILTSRRFTPPTTTWLWAFRSLSTAPARRAKILHRRRQRRPLWRGSDQAGQDDHDQWQPALHRLGVCAATAPRRDRRVGQAGPVLSRPDRAHHQGESGGSGSMGCDARQRRQVAEGSAARAFDAADPAVEVISSGLRASAGPSF